PDPSIQDMLKRWMMEQIERTDASAVLIQDAALLGLFEPNWSISTIDYMRGGIYPWTRKDGRVIPVLITVPVSAVYSQKKTKDIRAMNNGAESKSEWEEQRAFQQEIEGYDADNGDDSESPEEPEVEEYF